MFWYGYILCLRAKCDRNIFKRDVPARAARDDEAGVLENAQVLHDAEAGHRRQQRFELTERLAIALSEPVKQAPPIRIGQCPKDGFHLLHARDYM